MLQLALGPDGPRSLGDALELDHDADDAGEPTGTPWQRPEGHRSKKRGPPSLVAQTKLMKFQVWTWIPERSGTFTKNMILSLGNCY